MTILKLIGTIPELAQPKRDPSMYNPDIPELSAEEKKVLTTKCSIELSLEERKKEGSINSTVKKTN